jgi:hypothetical protein
MNWRCVSSGRAPASVKPWIQTPTPPKKKKRSNLVLVAHTCNPSYFNDGDQEDHGGMSLDKKVHETPLFSTNS